MSGHVLRPDAVEVMLVEGGTLTKPTNEAVALIWDADSIIGHVGDDHIFRTPGWDGIIEATLVEPGVAYGDDLLQGATLPTAVFMSSIIPKTLDWYALRAAQAGKPALAARLYAEAEAAFLWTMKRMLRDMQIEVEQHLKRPAETATGVLAPEADR